MDYKEAFTNSGNLITLIGEGNAYMIWALGLYMEQSDLAELASEGLTDGANDKKIDFIYLDKDNKKLIFAQGYYGSVLKDAAPANKASDLNTASAWLFSGETSELPDNLKGAIMDFRSSLASGEIESIELLYVHNLHESKNVTKELQTVAAHIRSVLGNSKEILVSAKELGLNTIQHLFSSQESHILVRDTIICPVKIKDYIKQTGPKWESVLLSVPGIWLRKLYEQHESDLFSANYRGFLGVKRKKINNAIKESAESSEKDFWVYNNGITLLTSDIRYVSKGIQLAGVSIINGAQTTGSIGSVNTSKYSLKGVQVLCRIIKCDDPDTINNIVKFNNTQNGITTWDQYSGDADQKRLEKEFEDLGHSYSRKRGFKTNGSAEQIAIEDVIQPLIAFLGQYGSANAGKNSIFDQKALYNKAFQDIKARHILFVYSVAKAVDKIRIELKFKSGSNTLKTYEEEQLRLLRNLRFKNFLLALTAQVLEPIVLWRVVPDSIAFSENTAKKYSLSELVEICKPVVEDVLGYVNTQVEADGLNELVQQDGALNKLAKSVVALLHAGRASEKFVEFTRLLSQS